MTTFTIDEQNNISAFSTQEEAAAATATPFDSFASQKELAELAKAWPAERLVAIFNSLTGVTPVVSFKSAQAAASRIWNRIQGLGDAAEPEAEPAKPTARKKPAVAPQKPRVAPTKGKASTKTTPAKKAPKAKKAGKAKEATGPREGSKTAQVIAMLQRKGGVTISEIMKAMKWQKHTVRGFMAGAMKKPAIRSSRLSPKVASAAIGFPSSISHPSLPSPPPVLAGGGLSASARQLASRGDTTHHLAASGPQASQKPTPLNRRATASPGTQLHSHTSRGSLSGAPFPGQTRAK